MTSDHPQPEHPCRAPGCPFAALTGMNAWVVWCPRSREALVVDPGGWDDRVRVGGHEGTVHELTGHTDDQLVLYLEGHLMAGDTLFAAALGGTPDPGRFHQQAAKLRRLLFRLPPDVVVHPGHGPVTEVGLERLFNPFLKGTEPLWKTALGGW